MAAIARLNPALNAIVQMDAASAWRAAAESDARIARGEARPLEGLPVTIKDCFETAGMVTAVGAPALKNYLPKEDASAVARLRGAGAIILGKTNVPLLTGDFQTANSVYGTTNNPWNLDFSPGGSSGGAAAAIATGMSTLELGSDLAGSIRWPAHCCGVFGLKTTWNVVATYGHIPPTPDMRLERNPELLVAGPLARSAADLEFGARCLGGATAPDDPSAKFASGAENIAAGSACRALARRAVGSRGRNSGRTPFAKPRSCWRKMARSSMMPRARHFPLRKPGRFRPSSFMH